MDKEKSRILAHSHPVIERLARHRWLTAGVGGISLLGVMTALAIAPDMRDNDLHLETVVEQLNTSVGALHSAETGHFLREELVQRSDTFHGLLSRLGITEQDALDFVRKNNQTQMISRQLRPGQLVSAVTGGNGELHALHLPIGGKDATLVVERKNGKLTASEQTIPLDTQTVIKSGEIRSSLFGASDAAGIPDAIATQLAEIFSGEIDFYRDLRKGDRFSLVYEILTHQGRAIRSGRILSAEFVNNQKTYQAFWFPTDRNGGGYYAADGKSLRKAFLRSPLEFSRVTSGFTSSRFHPVLQTWRAHRGIDYGAPIGTRVRAVADGSVDFVGQQGGYGNLVILKHQSGYSTAYGHLKGFGQGIRKYSRVTQGETIGYVGQTGLASGPHLHYEFRINNQPINPLAAVLPAATPLDTNQLSRFKNNITPLRAQLDVAQQTRYAAAE